MKEVFQLWKADLSTSCLIFLDTVQEHSIQKEVMSSRRNRNPKFNIVKTSLSLRKVTTSVLFVVTLDVLNPLETVNEEVASGTQFV